MYHAHLHVINCGHNDENNVTTLTGMPLNVDIGKENNVATLNWILVNVDTLNIVAYSLDITKCGHV